MRKWHGNVMLGLAAFCAVQLIFLYYWWVFTDAWPPFVQGRPIDGVIAPLAIGCVFFAFVGACVRDVGKD